MVHNVEFSCSHISFVWLHGLNSLQWWLLTCPDLTNVVWFKNNIDRHEYPKQLQAHPAKKSEIPDTRNTRWFWKKIGYGLGIAKNYRVGSGIGYPSGTACDVLPVAKFSFERLPWTLPQMVQMKPKLWPSLGVRYKLMQDAHHWSEEYGCYKRLGQLGCIARRSRSSG